jgi:hypothetical protein
MRSRIGVCAILTMLFSILSLAQSSQTSPTSAPPADSAQSQDSPNQAEPNGPLVRRSRTTRKPPCWSVVHIPPEFVNQRWQMEENAHQKINGVCSDSTLSPEQKSAKINEIKAKTDQEIAKRIPSQQFEALKTCEAERDKEKAKQSSGTPQKELGPCGGVIPAPGSSPHDHEHTPGKPSN